MSLLPLFLAILLSVHGLRRKSLSPSGAVTAFVIGLLTMAGGLRVFGVALIGFYLIGSWATKCQYVYDNRPTNKTEAVLFFVQMGKRRRQSLRKVIKKVGTEPDGRS